jgi:hypothetical protein
MIIGSRFHFLFQHNILTGVFLSVCPCLLKWSVIDEFLVTLDVNRNLDMWYNQLSAEFGPSWTNIVLFVFQLKVTLGCGNRLKQKCYCKSDDPHRRLQYYQSYLCWSQEHYSPSAWAREPTIIHTCKLSSQITQEVEQWPPLVCVIFSQTLVFWTLLRTQPNSNTIPCCIQLSAMSIMRTTYNESFISKVSKH